MKFFLIVLLIYLSLISVITQEEKFLRYLQNSNVDFISGEWENGKNIFSSNGMWMFSLQTDGNLVLKDLSEYTYWSSNSNGKGVSPYKLATQDDGNLVIYDSTEKPVWSNGTVGKGKSPYKLVLQGDGNLVLYDANMVSYWATGTSYASNYPESGCVWLFTECNFKGTKTEYCSDKENLDKTASSILLKQGLSVKVYGGANYSGEVQDITSSLMCLKSVNFDKKIASIKYSKKPCATNEFLSNGNCMKCPSKCATCESSVKCLTCESNLSINQNSGLCGTVCPPGQFDNNGTCAPCSTNCATCLYYNKCLTCANGKRLNSLQVCEIDCPPNQYASNDQCFNCPTNCETCSSPNICKTCQGNAILNAQSLCDLKCSTNQFLLNGSCESCPGSCSSCNDKKTCTGCINGYFSFNGECVAQCPDGTVKKNNKCIKIVTCPNGNFQDFNNDGECSSCGDKCLKCVSKTACYQCDGNFNLIGYDTTTKNYVEVSAEVGLSLDGPSISFGVKKGSESTKSFSMGIGDWGLGIGPNPQSPIPNPQSPIPKISVKN
jgi:hypothetical protein